MKNRKASREKSLAVKNAKKTLKKVRGVPSFETLAFVGGIIVVLCCSEFKKSFIDIDRRHRALSC
ncbi:MAG TPA: hypothetical protein VFG02_06955, partial [Nitrospirota bacterium]|nr:hypothetical protein [Nitrospirota bacterium]